MLKELNSASTGAVQGPASGAFDRSVRVAHRQRFADSGGRFRMRQSSTTRARRTLVKLAMRRSGWWTDAVPSLGNHELMWKDVTHGEHKADCAQHRQFALS